jgi:hypothetical protein
MSGDLRALAEKYVTLSGEIEAVRRAMLSCLTNGAGDDPVRPISPARQASGGSQPSHPNAVTAQQAEEKIIEVLRSSPGMGTAAVARATASKVNTTTQRLGRTRERGLITRGDDGSGWTASAAP